MDYLLLNQNKDGLFSYTKKEDMSCIDSTAQFILGAMKSVQVIKVSKYKRAIIKAVQALIDCSEDAHWGTTKISKPVVSSTAFVLLALKSATSLFEDTNKIETIIQLGINRLVNIRNEDGGWGIQSGDESKSCTTALALLAIKTCLPSELMIKEDIISQAKHFIINSQLDDGSWQDVIEREAGFTVIRFSTPYCLSALIETDV